MKVEGWIIAAVTFAIAQAIAIVGAWWNMRAKVDKHEAKLAQIESDHEKQIGLLTAAQNTLTATVGTIQIEIAKGFARIEEQIKTLFREQEKH